MRKEVVDEIVTEYLQKIYGFELTKTGKIDIAEDYEYLYEVYSNQIQKDLYPPYILDWIKYSCASPLAMVGMYVAEILVEDGILKLPSDEQKHGLSTLMFIN